ncbi:MAG: DUF4458 domain-containing protein [Alistipes sp.]|nr:DUF4458 domain-containing protein [Alistipes sp.]
MKQFKYIYAMAVILTSLFVVGCSEDDGVDNRDHDYGYVQFKLYNEASAELLSRGVQTPLEQLSEAKKVKVAMLYEGTTISQTLNLLPISEEASVYGLRTDKLKLLTGKYEVLTFTLYNVDEEEIYSGAPHADRNLEVVMGGLSMYDLQVAVTPRGMASFTLTKDLSALSRAAEREYTFDEIAYATLTVEHLASQTKSRLEKLPAEFSIHFDETDDVEDGYQTSSLKCDSLVWLMAGDYRLLGYELFDEKKILLESESAPAATRFTINTNRKTEISVPVKLHAADAYLKDCYALYEIWQSLNGPSWSYYGEEFATGANWDFNKDPDLWCAQPGVQVHANGRVARVDLSNFGVSGHLSPAIGQLTELVELYLGTHNDTNLLTYDPSLSRDKSLAERQANRLEYHKQYLQLIHPATPFSEPMARALAEHNITLPNTAYYEKYTERELIDEKGAARRLVLHDTQHGTICNGIKSLPEEIGNLKKLSTLFIANSEIEALPEALKELTSCTDLEIYNCPRMTKFPTVVGEMPELISVNLSNNLQWSAEEVLKGFNALAEGPSKEKIQILYMRENNLEEIPLSIRNMKKIGLLDFAYNKIKTTPAWGKDIAPLQLYLDNNQLESLPVDEEGYFCGYDDVETFSVRFNKLKKFPNIFSADCNFTMKSVDFSGNDITGFEGEEDGSYRGLKVETLSMSQNYNLKKYPAALWKAGSTVAYIVLRACGLEEFPEGSFQGKQVINLVSLDLSYNKLTDLPWEMHAGNVPYLYGVDLSFNSFSRFPYEPLDADGLTVLSVRSQRDSEGRRCLREWPTGIYQHVGLRGLYLGSNDLREVNDTISTLCYYLDISDNPNIVFDASDICYAWQVGAYILYYDKTQNIKNCDLMLQ